MKRESLAGDLYERCDSFWGMYSRQTEPGLRILLKNWFYGFMASRGKEYIDLERIWGVAGDNRRIRKRLRAARRGEERRRRLREKRAVERRLRDKGMTRVEVRSLIRLWHRI